MTERAPDGDRDRAADGAGAPAAVVFDSNIDALARRVRALGDAAPGLAVTPTASRTAVLVLAAAAPEGTPVFVDLYVAESATLDRPGERLIQRLTRVPQTAHVRPVAWSAHVGPEVVAGIRAAGGRGFVTSSLRVEREADELRAVLAGEPVWPRGPVPDDGSWEAWFADTYGAGWEPWMEPILVRLAAGQERRSVAADLVALGAARSTNHAATRLRDVARLIAGEHSNSPPAVARRATVALARLAARRPLVERPAMPVSLARGAAILRASPSYAVAAGLTPVEIEDVLALDARIAEYRAAQPSAPGAPHADRVGDERRWAAGKLAAPQVSPELPIDEVIAGILTRVDDALVALDDAVDDEAGHPAPRAAAALLALEAAGRGDIEGARKEQDGRLRWEGRTPAELAIDGELEPRRLRALTASIDRSLVAG